MIPDKPKGGPRQTRPNVSLPSKTDDGHHDSRDHRQPPVERWMLVHERRPGRRWSDGWPLDHCPTCGYMSRHLCEWPPPPFMWKSCPTCGMRDQYRVIEVRAGHRRREAA